MKKIILVLLVIALNTSYVSVYAETTEDRITAVESTLYEIDSLFDACNEKGIDTSYELADYSIIKDFIGYGRQDIEWGHTDRAEYVADCLEDMFSSVKTTLQDYLEGNKTPLPGVKNYASDYVGTNKNDFVDKDGKPIIFNGYGVFDMVKNDVYKLQNYGADIIQLEIGPNAVLAEEGAINGWGATVYNDAVATVSLSDRGENSDSCLKIVNETPTDAEGQVAVRHYIPVKPNTTYTLSMSARTNSAGTVFFSAQGWTGARCNLSKGTTAWTNYSVEHTTAADEYQLEILIISNNASKAVYIDNVSLVEKGTQENLLINGDFEDCDLLASKHFLALDAPIEYRVSRVLDRAYESGVMVDVLISTHYFPEWILTKYPETTTRNSGLGYDIDNDIIKEALDLYVKAIMTEIADHPALLSVCISNEPNVDTRLYAGLEEDYSNYLAEAYNYDIGTLNKAYSSEYKEFSEVLMPTQDTMNAAYYDWVQYNNAYGAKWNRFLAGLVNKYAPKVPIHAKMMTTFGKSTSLNFGTDPEDFAEFTDFSGNDSYGFLGSNASGLISKLMWYDLLSAIKPDAPVINSEDHIIKDGDTNYESRQATHVAADIWQGAVHNRDASVLWIWNRTSNTESSTYGNILYRPDALSGVSKRSLDINRLSEQVAALQKAESKVSILYSPTTRAYSTSAIKVLTQAYTAGLYSGVKPAFITERQLASGILPKGVLVVPMVTHISDEAFKTIEEFKSRGGKVYVIGDNCLAYDEHGFSREQTITADYSTGVSIIGSTILSPSVNTLAGNLREYANGVAIYDTAGNVLSEVEVISAECNSKKIWNLCNYSWSKNKEVSIPAEAVDLITGEKYTDSVTLKPFVPVLLEYCGGDFSIETNVITGEGKGRSIEVEITNTGLIGEYLNTSITVKNADGSKTLEKADIRKYVRKDKTEVLTYNFTVPADGFSAVISAYTDDGTEVDRILINE